MFGRGITNINIKCMGKINEEAFENTCMQRYPRTVAEMKAIEVCFHWQEKLENPEWHPFKVIQIDGKHQVSLKKWLLVMLHFRTVNQLWQSQETKSIYSIRQVLSFESL